MKQYAGVKVLGAEPMTRAEYNVLRQWELPADENGEDKGYLVEYQNGSNSNVNGYKGYISWSPKKQFEDAYNLFSDDTIGAKRVALRFNPSNDTKVDKIKLLSAMLINEIQSVVEPQERSEAARQVNKAITDIEVGCMHGVKANFV